MGVSDYLPHFLARQFRSLRADDFPDVLIPFDQADRRQSLTTDPTDNGRRTSTSSPDSEKGEKGVTKSADATPGNENNSIEGLRAEIEADMAAFGVDSAYDRKSKIINKAIQDMGMGRYQWELFVLCGFGWFADNFWLQGVALILTQLSAEFGISETNVRFTTFSLFIGLTIGASFWGIAADVIGRRLAFNTTLFMAGVFGISVGGADSWVTVCALLSCVGLGVGGNLPVDGALFLEFLPFASGNLLTLLSIWWPVGSLIASMIAWGLIPSFACSTAQTEAGPCSANGGAQPCCDKQSNYGWRYFTFTLGAITILQWVCRFLLFQMLESPKFLLSKGRQTESVAVVRGIAHFNKSKTWLTEEILNEVGGYPDEAPTNLSVAEIIKHSLSKFSTERIGPLFQGWKLVLSTVLIWFCWLTIGMGYPLFNAFLPQYLSQSGAGSTSTYTQYRNYAITTVCGVPGSAIAAFTVDIKYIGRKGTIAAGTMLTGIFVFLFTASADADFQLAFSSLEGFFQNIMYGVLYAYTPEVFPAPNRGTATGIASTLNRIGGFCAPLIGIYAGEADPKAPIYASGALILAAFVAMIFFPIETRGRQSL